MRNSIGVPYALQFPVMEEALILRYMAHAYETNTKAEVSGLELQRELGLDERTVRRCVSEMARQSLVEWDPHLHNMWLRITDKGLARAAAYEVRRPPEN